MATSSQKGELGLALEVLTQRFSAPTNLLFLLHLLVGGGQLSILLVVNAFGRVGVLVQCLHLTALQFGKIRELTVKKEF